MQEAKYIRIIAELRREILEGKYDSSGVFPSEMQLVRRFGASRKTVQRAIDELKRGNYIVRRQGSGTRVSHEARNASGKIGLIVPGMAHEEIFPSICQEIVRLAELEGYSVLLGHITDSDPALRAKHAMRLAREFVDEHVAGVIFQPIELVANAKSISREIVQYLDAHFVRTVLLDYDVVPSPGRSPCDVIGIDNWDAGSQIATHLIESGARRIHFLMRPNWAPSVWTRMQGLIATAVSAGLEWNPKINVLYAEPNDASALSAHLRKCRRKRPDAFVCGNDTAAAILMRTLREIGLEIPRDVRIAGFDDVQHARITNPPLTTVRQPCQEIAETAFSALMQRLRRPRLPPREILLRATLVARGSTAFTSQAKKRRFK